VHLMDGYFVTPKHVSDAYSLSDDSEVEFRDRIPDVIFDIMEPNGISNQI